VDAGPPSIALVGRFDRRDAAGPVCAWPGCVVLARFVGTFVAVDLRERVDAWMAGTPSEWDVAIDGARLPKIVTVANASQRFVLASNLALGEHLVELYRRSEAQTGVTQIKGFDFGGGSLLSPPPRRARRIEVIGDSSVAGFGIDGPGPTCPGVAWAARWEDFHQTFAAHLGDELDAEVMGTAYSGKGLVKNIDPSDPVTLGELYPRTNPLDSDALWDFSSFVADVVIVMVGGNDFGQPPDGVPATLDAFTDAYEALVTTVRGHYPGAAILLATSGSVSDADPPGRSTRTNITTVIGRVVALRQAAGDTRVGSAAPREADASEVTGCDGHGNAAYHRRVAGELAPVVRAIAGW
jgi:lysophospholipase L1-like esterase